MQETVCAEGVVPSRAVQEDGPFSVVWSEEDNEYVGRCATHSGLSYSAADAESALAGIRFRVVRLERDTAAKAASQGADGQTIEQLLRNAGSPHKAYEGLQTALTRLARNEALHMRHYREDLVADLLWLLPLALSGEIEREDAEEAALKTEEMRRKIDGILQKAQQDVESE